MSRQGCLSDLAVKQRFPEMTPLDIAGQELLHPIHLQKSIFRGIKVPKKSKRFTDVSRYPINDLKNFAQFGSAGNEKEIQFLSIQNYRKELGSNNYSPHLQTAFHARNRADYIPPPNIRPDEGAGGVQVPATLSLGRTRSVDIVKDTLNLIAEPKHHNYLTDIEKLNKVYRDDAEELGIVEEALHTASASHILPIPINLEE